MAPLSRKFETEPVQRAPSLHRHIHADHITHITSKQDIKYLLNYQLSETYEHLILLFRLRCQSCNTAHE
jgi:hypothetical protein